MLSLAEAVVDGEAVDWAELTARVDDALAEAALRDLKLVDSIRRFHGSHVPEVELLDAASTPIRSDPDGGPAVIEPEREIVLWGHIELLEKVGRGAFGEVYRGWDTKLSREVALKLLFHSPPEGDPGGALSEASILARVRHRNVVTVYSADCIGGRVGLWMEFVRGRTLAQSVGEFGPFSHREATLLGVEICRAVEAVHATGLVHRDIKAQNVMREWGGRIVLMDFGTGREWSVEHADLKTDSMGTPLYAAPELLTGEQATPRTDIYSIGVLLFYLMTGRYPVSGRTVSDVRSAHRDGVRMMARDALPDIPAELSIAIDRALSSNPEDRHANVGAFADRLGLVLAGAHGQDSRTKAPAAHGDSRWLRRGLVIATLLAAAAATALILQAQFGSNPPTRVSVSLTPAEHLKMDPLFNRPLATAIALSPDGRRLAFVGQTGARRQLYVRDLGAATALAVPDSDGASSPAFSPDGRWLAFAAGNLIRKAPVSGGVTVTLAEVVRRVKAPAPASRTYTESEAYGLAWRNSSAIVFGRFAGGLWQVPAAGGTPEPLTELDRHGTEFAHRLPNVLPGGDHVLFTAVDGVAASSTEVVVMNLNNGERKSIVADAADGRYVTTGHLTFVRRGQLLAVPFDLARLATANPSVPIVDGVMQSLFSYRNQLNVGAAQYAFSGDGDTLAYVQGSVFPDETRTLVWVDLDGREVSAGHPEGAYMRPDVSPDGRSVLFTCWDRGRAFVCWLDFERQVSRPISEGLWPLWTMDGTRAVFSRLGAGGTHDLFWMPVETSAQPERLVDSTRDLWSGSWNPTGSVLAFVETSESTDNDIWTVALSERAPRPFLQSPAREDHPEFSPDGRWLAYASNESGRDEVYVTPYPGAGEEYQISVGGGTGPVWSPDGRRLYYTVGEDQGLALMIVDVRNTPKVHFTSPRRLFVGSYAGLASVRGFDISRDGRRFLFVKLGPAGRPVTHVNVVLDWEFSR